MLLIIVINDKKKNNFLNFSYNFFLLSDLWGIGGYIFVVFNLFIFRIWIIIIVFIGYYKNKIIDMIVIVRD